MPEKDDSIEYDQKKIAEILKNLGDEEEYELGTYNEAVKAVKLDDDGQPMLCSSDMANILEQQQQPLPS